LISSKMGDFQPHIIFLLQFFSNLNVFGETIAPPGYDPNDYITTDMMLYLHWPKSAFVSV